VDRAIALLEQTRSARAAKLGADHPSTYTSQANLAKAYLAAGRVEQAIALLEATLEARTAKLGSDHPATLTTQYDLAVACDAAGDAARAESIYRELLESRKRKLGAEHPDVAQVLSALGANLLEQQKWAEAEPLLRESLAIWDAKRPDDWSRFDAQSRLGGSLLSQKKYAEAERWLLSGYNGLKAREAKLPVSSVSRLSRALQRLLDLYTAQDNRTEANKWRQILDESKAITRAAESSSKRP
jgi:eukaryotic-like serine/threonine-protein kinase